MNRRTALIISILSISSITLAQSASTPHLTKSNQEKAREEVMGSLKQARVFIDEPKDGATVSRTFKVKMVAEGIKVRPAGEAPEEVTSGHHHLIIDAAPIPAGQPVPADEKHVHFGKGQTEAELTLSPGKHVIILQFADGAHRSFGDRLMHKIQINVK